MGQVDISFFVIATKKYKEFAFDLLKSASKYLSPITSAEFIVLTDEASYFDVSTGELPVRAKFVQIPSLGWPEATLLRYHLMVKHWNEVSGKIVSYIDADTEFVSFVQTSEFFDKLNFESENQIVLVRHPGYFNRAGVIMRILQTRVGPWEHRKMSSAFIDRRRRIDYVCGGVYWGCRESFFEFLTELCLLVDKDSVRGICAKFHDESYLNKWKSSANPTLASPEWAYAPGYKNLRDISPKISVIHKSRDFEREPSTDSPT